MLDRVNLGAVVRGHWKSLRIRHGEKWVSDSLTKALLLSLPTVLAVPVFANKTNLSAPAAIVTAMSLLSGALLAAFAQIASIRAKFPTPDDTRGDANNSTRDMLDESVAHILLAAGLAATTAMITLVSMELSKNQELDYRPGAIVTWIGTYLFLLFVMTIRKLYAAYDEAHEISEDLSGHVR